MQHIVMPPVGKGTQTGTVRQWFKKAGESVKKGEPLVRIETEEMWIDVEAGRDTTLQQIAAAEGATVAVGAMLGTLGGGEAKAAPVPAVAAPASTPAAAPSGAVTPVLMPQAGQSMEEGTIVKWRVEVGAKINKGDVIFEVETDKATMEVEAIDSGRLARIVLPEGGTIAVKQPVAYLADNDADVDAYLATQPAGAAPAAAATVAGEAAPVAASTQPHSASAPAVVEGGRVKASPAARKIAREKGIELAAVGIGSGPGGRILSTDVLSAKPSAAAPITGGVQRRKMSKMRKAIAANLLASKQNIPHFYVRLTVNADAMFAFYRGEKAKYPCSVNDVVTLACAKAIREFPQFRSRIDKDEIVEFDTVNIGIAVGVDDGLTVPVLLGADRMSLQDVSANTKRIVEAARVGKLEGLGQGNFTITNLGMFGVEEFAAIVNPPEPAILAVGAARESVIAKDGALRIGKVMTVTLSCDHRLIDGLLAAKFLARLKDLMESPTQLL